MNFTFRLFGGGNFHAAPVSLLICMALTMSICAQAEIKNPVRVEGGLISGGPVPVEGVMVFKGIPYAAPPVGALRWREPQPMIAWSGVRKAEQFGHSCIQKPMQKGAWYQIEEYSLTQPVPVSEDCLFLNVWTPAKSASAKLPVIVWFYGGGFAQGSGSMPLYSGQELAKRGVVVVTLNYRLGIFGFLAHPELTKESPHNVSGNYGVLDQVAALKWVHNNISAFGGIPIPSRSTVSRQGQGA